MKKDYKIQFILWYIHTVLQAIIYGVKAYNDMPTTMIGIIGGGVLTLMYACIWLYYEEDVPKGGMWFHTNGGAFCLDDIILTSDSSIRMQIYKIEVNRFYAVPYNESLVWKK